MILTKLCLDQISKYDDSNKRYRLGNKILYDMVSANPSNTNEDLVANKIWVIGRTYSASVEICKKTGALKLGDFYYDHVAPHIAKSELDKKINDIKAKKYKSPDDPGAAEDILDLHHYLVSLLKPLTQQEKRSLASKYLHFHLPELVFIYDHITAKNAKLFVDDEGVAIIPPHPNHTWDREYAELFFRELEIYREISKYSYPSGDTLPRVVDNLLLRY